MDLHPDGTNRARLAKRTNTRVENTRPRRQARLGGVDDIEEGKPSRIARQHEAAVHAAGGTHQTRAHQPLQDLRDKEIRAPRLPSRSRSWSPDGRACDSSRPCSGWRSRLAERGSLQVRLCTGCSRETSNFWPARFGRILRPGCASPPRRAKNVQWIGTVPGIGNETAFVWFLAVAMLYFKPLGCLGVCVLLLPAFRT